MGRQVGRECERGGGREVGRKERKGKERKGKERKTEREEGRFRKGGWDGMGRSLLISFDTEVAKVNNS